MEPIAQLVRASRCGREGRGFESHWAPSPSHIYALLQFEVTSELASLTDSRTILAYKSFVDHLSNETYGEELCSYNQKQKAKK
jgi:hypothetical protein